MHDANTIREWQEGKATRWHLSWRAAIGREFFAEPALYERVRGRLFDAHRRQGRALVHYLLLPTEIHVISQVPAGDSPGSIARAIGNIVSRWVQATQAVKSPVLAGPFHAMALGSTVDLHALVRMLAWRPVRKGLCVTPLHYAHGSLRIFMGQRSVKGFEARTLLHEFGPNVQTARVGLRNCLKRRPTDLEWAEWELVNGLILASGEIATEPTGARSVRGVAAAALVAAGGRDGIDGALRLLEAWVIAKIGAQGVTSLRYAAGAPGARGRALVACLAVEYRLCSASAVARYFGRARSTLSEQMVECRARGEDRAIIGTAPSRVLAEAGELLAERT